MAAELIERRGPFAWEVGSTVGDPDGSTPARDPAKRPPNFNVS